MKLILELRKIPRTVNRTEWYGIWRWKRVIEKKIAEEARKQSELLTIYGNTLPVNLKEKIAGSLMNPPLLLGPYQ